MGWREKTYVINDEFIEEHWGWRKKRIACDDIVEIAGLNWDMLGYTSIWLAVLDSKGTEFQIEELNPAFKILEKMFSEKYVEYPKDRKWMGLLEIDGVGWYRVLWRKAKEGDEPTSRT
ncbi:MAG: hypothetical protein K2P94_06915 [Rhodospirillaceae bacterium]|nr:hypothetical protein [Rhodospirillaceae bacterium]